MYGDIELDQIRLQFGNEIYKRGKEYYYNGHVSRVTDDGKTITANVDGSGNNVYIVVIDRNQKGIIASSICSCPYRSFCKHAAATLIYYHYHGAHVNVQREVANPLLEPEKEQTEKFFDIKKKNRSSRINEIFSNIVFSEQLKDENAIIVKERWKAIFVISEQQNKFYYTDFDKDSLIISLGLLYIKKDGSFGRIADFKREKLTEPLENEVEQKLFNSLVSKNNFSQRFDSYFDFFIENTNLPLYVKKNSDYFKADFIEIGKIIVDFKLTQIDSRTELTAFKLFLNITDKDGGSVYLINDQKPNVFFDRIVIVADNGKIFYKTSDNIYMEFVSKIFEYSYYYGEDIDILRNFVDKHLKDEVIWKFNKDKLKIIKFRPKPIIEIQNLSLEKESYYDLFFDYNNREIESKNDNIDLMVLSDAEVPNEIIVADRDKDFEDSVKAYLSTKLKKIDITSKASIWTRKNDFILKTSVKNFLLEYGLQLIDEGYNIRFKNEKTKLDKSGGKVAVKVTSGIDWFDINTDFVTDNGDIKNFKITREVVTNGLVQIGNSFVILSKEDIKKLSKLLDEGMDENGKLKVSKLNFGVIDSLYSSISNNDMDELKFAKEISEKLKNFEKIKKNKLPQYFNGTLREYQESGYNWLHFLHKYSLNGCLADDMGLGKTVQTLALLQNLKETGALGISLLVVPVTTVANWESEITRFAPNLKFVRHLGQERVKDRDFFKDYDIIISSYHTLRNDIEFFNDFEFDYLILDEAQNIKNHASLIFKTVRIIKAKHKLSLTGTPVENNTTELWSQFNFLNPSLLGSIHEFKNKFVTPIEARGDKEAAERLRKTIYPFVLRRKKEEVAKDLPEKEEIVVYCEMNAEQKKVYNALNEYYKGQIGDALEQKGIEKSAIQIFEALLRLRQVALFPVLASEEYKNVESIKFETLKDLMEEIIEEKHKVLLFSQFVQSLKIIENEAQTKKIKYSYIDGQTKKRDVEIKKFQEQEDVNLFLLSLKAGGVGINMTAADYVILFDPWWNPAAESQAVDRSHRIGQTKKVMVYKLIVKNTVEEKILELQNKKKELVSQLITEEASFFKSLSKSDIMNLF